MLLLSWIPTSKFSTTQLKKVFKVSVTLRCRDGGAHPALKWSTPGPTSPMPQPELFLSAGSGWYPCSSIVSSSPPIFSVWWPPICRLILILSPYLLCVVSLPPARYLGDLFLPTPVYRALSPLPCGSAKTGRFLRFSSPASGPESKLQPTTPFSRPWFACSSYINCFLNTHSSCLSYTWLVCLFMRVFFFFLPLSSFY